MEFRTLTAGSKLYEAVQEVFHQGLNQNILKELACKDQALFPGMVNLNRDCPTTLLPAGTYFNEHYCANTSDSMELSRSHLSKAEKVKKANTRIMHVLCQQQTFHR